MSVDLDRNVVLRGEVELAERAGHLFDAREEFVCAAQDLRTWALPGVRDEIIAKRARRPGLLAYKLHNPAALADEDSERRLVEIAKRGPRVRICATPLPHETIVIDRRIAILAGPPRAGVREYTIVRSPGVVKGVISLFWATWETAAELADYRRDRPPALSEESRHILRLLGGGLKDEAAARRLGLSLRTYRRRVAEILTLLDAESRFQAGLRAHELGLLG
ncbi:LuxR family transcriptional regulator [Actinomadura macra]|uniref:LuxR family transcriptional regulator n=1 Tax=Actinomadura macra TaxID=46164 RepID=UPI000829ACD0|nr:LuxR family transcriptional regulator [Actinomadura macra]